MKKVLLLSLLIPISFIPSQAHAFNAKFAAGVAAGIVSVLSMRAGVKYVKNNKQDNLAALTALPLVAGSIASAAVSALLIAEPTLPVQNAPTAVRMGLALAKIAAGTTAAAVSAGTGMLAIVVDNKTSAGKHMKAGFAITSASTAVLSAIALDSALDVNVTLKY